MKRSTKKRPYLHTNHLRQLIFINVRLKHTNKNYFHMSTLLVLDHTVLGSHEVNYKP